MSASPSRRWSLALAGLLAAALVGVGLVGLEQLSHAVSSDSSAPPPALIGLLADDYAAPMLRILGTPDPAPASVAATIRITLLVAIALGVLLAVCGARSLAASRRPSAAR